MTVETSTVMPQLGGRAARFLAVTVITAVLGQVLIYSFFVGFRWSAVVANSTAVGIVALVGFWLSVRYVWTADSSGNDRRSQAAIYIALSLLGLVVSTVTVSLTVDLWSHDLAANVGSFVGYGIAWVIRFGVLDRYVFSSESPDRWVG